MQHIGQEKGEEDLPEGVLSVSLLKHQVPFLYIIEVSYLFSLLRGALFICLFYVSKKIALVWMVSRENSTHCSGGILADDQVISYFPPYSNTF